MLSAKSFNNLDGDSTLAGRLKVLGNGPKTTRKWGEEAGGSSQRCRAPSDLGASATSVKSAPTSALPVETRSFEANPVAHEPRHCDAP
jgi:hypothetical protein